MSTVISVRVADDESKILSDVSSVYGLGVSSLLKQLAFEKLEDMYDLRAIREYEQERANGTLELISHEDVWRRIENDEIA